MEPPTEPASAAPPPALLTREEWLACFPAAAPATGGLGTLPGPPDPAAALRDAAPLTQSSMLRALAPWPSMRAVLSAQFATGALHFAIMPAQLLTHFFNLAIMGAMFWFLEQANFAGFGRSNAVVGVTAGVVVNASGLLSYLVFLVSREARMEYLSWFEVKSLDYNYCAQAVRWSELCSGVLKHGEMEDGGCLGSFSKGRLVAHDPDDKLCPCPDERCAGQLLWQAAVAAASTALVVTTAAVTSMGVCMVWTPFVTLRLQFWSTWWSVLLAVVFLVSMVTYFVTSLAHNHITLPLLRLTLRIHHRAMHLALSDLVDGYRAVLEDSAAVHRGCLETASAYASLYARIKIEWQTRLRELLRGRGFAATAAASLVAAGAINIIGGSCLPAYIPIWLLLGFVYVFATDMAGVAVSNAQISDITALFRDARAALGELSMLATLPGTSPAPQAAIITSIGEHQRLLGSFADADRYKVRLFGFAIDYSGVRAVLATLLTIALGLWTVLRSAGVFLTLETVCPSP